MTTRVVEEIDFLLAEAAQLIATGPHFRIWHRFRRAGTDCSPGEEVAAVWLMQGGRRYTLSLTTATLIMFDYIARHRALPQTASQIESGLRRMLFYAKHGSRSGRRRHRRFVRTTVKEYVKRIRRAIAAALKKARVPMKSQTVLASRRTVGNEVGYQLKATITWVHTEEVLCRDD